MSQCKADCHHLRAKAECIVNYITQRPFAFPPLALNERADHQFQLVNSIDIES
jgi:hypothetical protein